MRGIRHVERAPVLAAEGEVGGGAAGNAAQHPFGFGAPVEYPHHAQARVRDEHPPLPVHGEAVRAAGPVGSEELAHLGHAAVGQQRHAPHAVAACDGQIQHAAVGRKRHAVGAGHVVQQQIELAVGAQAVEAPGRVMQPALPLVGEVEIAFGIEDQVVHALEALAVAALQVRRHMAGGDVEPHQPVLVVGDEQRAGIEELHAVGLAVVFGHEAPGALRVDAEDAAPGDVAHIKVARVVEHRAFEERVGDRAAAVGVGPVAALGAAQGCGHGREGFQVTDLGGLQQEHGTVRFSWKSSLSGLIGPKACSAQA